jgi:flagellar biosynthesis anti-sigma factor FlgM
MQIYGTAHVHSAHSVSAPHPSSQASPRISSAAAASDELSISDAARFLESANSLPDVRHDLVRDIRAAIAEGRYETGDKLDAAVSRLLDEIG